MLYENFFKWLFHDRRKRCGHEWAEKGWTHSLWLDATSESGFRHLWVCTKCGAKEKRTPRNPPNMIWY